MEKVLVVYYSRSGNTQAMAHAIAQGLAINKTLEVDVEPVGMIHPSHVAEYAKIIMGCPASGMEELQQEDFEPFYMACKAYLHDKPVALFGSYGMGVGHWMKRWEERVKEDGATLFEEGFICYRIPEGEMLEELMMFGKRFGAYKA
jgi:flavodoxin I